MRALQHHYTSCRKGQLGSAGFQTRAGSEDLRPDEQREIERRGIYAPPRNALGEPTVEQIVEDYPRAFRYYLLDSGKWALTYSCYAGQDYSGRWGNYFAHSLVAGAAPRLWPIDYYEWEGWRTRLPDEEDTDELPPPLPEVDLSRIAPAESFALEELKEFLKEVPGRRAALEAMVRAVFLRQQTSRSLVIRDSFISGLFWVACIQKCFPLACAREISFSTYQFDDRNCAAINATTGETDFSFDETQRKYQFFMFDFTTNHHSEVPEAGADYAAIVTAWMAGDPPRLTKFHRFLSLFANLKVDSELVCAARLFQISEGESQSLTAEELGSIINFADKFTAPHGQAQVVEILGRLTPVLGPSVGHDAYQGLIRLLVGGAVATGKPALRDTAFNTWIRMFDSLVIERGTGFDSVRAARDHLVGSLGEFEQELAKMFLSDLHITQIERSLPRLQPEVTEEILSEMLISHDALRRRPVWKQPAVLMLINAVLNSAEDPRQSAFRVFKMLKYDETALVGICRLIADREAGRPQEKGQNGRRIAAGRALATVLDTIKPDQAFAIRKDLDQPATWALLFGEWLEIIDRSENKPKTYDDYLNSVAAPLKGYSKTCGTDLAQSLMERLPADQKQQQAMLWVQSKQIKYFAQPFAETCIKQANQAIPLDPENAGAKKAAQQLKKLAIEYEVSLHPNRPYLFETAVAAQQNTTFEQLAVPGLQPALTGIDVRTYAQFLKGFLPAAFAKVRQAVEHQALIRAVYQPDHRHCFKDAYLDSLGNHRRERFTVSERVALMYWLSASWRSQKLPGLGDLEEAVLDALVKRISALSEAEINRLNDDVWARKRELGQAGRDRWQFMSDEVTNQKRSLLSKLFGRRKP